VYLHYVFDLWIHHWRKHHATGDVIIVRYADNIVAGFENPTRSDFFPVGRSVCRSSGRSYTRTRRA
jgi:hypothetical protein